MKILALNAAQRRRLLALALVCLAVLPLSAAALSDQEIKDICADSEDPPQCGKFIERVQLKRHPGIGVRSGDALEIHLRQGDPAIFTDVDAGPQGNRDYSLWDVFNVTDYVVVWLQEDEASRYLLINRRSGLIDEMPGEPVLAPDRRNIASADFCVKGCANELSLWQVQRNRLQKLSVYKPAERWIDAGVKWIAKDALLLDVEVDLTGSNKLFRSARRTLTIKLDDPGWKPDGH
jgi:hypothetical protein